MAPPPLTEANVRHLLRRTEFVDRPHRVSELMAMESIDAAVADVLAVSADPPSVTFTAPADRDWERGQDLTHFWLDRMAHDSARPLQERLAFFWHGHFCSEFGKVGSSMLMREQIDLWRREGLGDIHSLASTMSTQVAMIRYLDNNRNKKSSPNQNFARELMELFLLGVGNYTEADVEASTAAWTGHSDQWDDDVSPYRWRPDWHDPSPKSFLGRPINTDPATSAWPGHGPETISVILGNGVVPSGADNVANRGRPTRDVAAEFLSRKLWTSFATDTPPPAGVAGAMRSALTSTGFSVRPWVTAMLTHPDFYSESVKQGLVRTPVEYVVALMVATGQRSRQANVTWLMESMGQRLLFPPNVSGWRPNGYWVNASAMEGRARTAQSFSWASSRDYWKGTDGPITLAGGSIMRSEITARTPPTQLPTLSNDDLVARLLDLMRLRYSPAAVAEIVRYANGATVWERNNALLLIMLAPELHLA
jgi:uncharacterized protein (DUF1800 family)